MPPIFEVNPSSDPSIILPKQEDIVLDTNILVFMTRPGNPNYKFVRKLLKDRQGSIFITPNQVMELPHIITKFYYQDEFASQFLNQEFKGSYKSLVNQVSSNDPQALIRVNNNASRAITLITKAVEVLPYSINANSGKEILNAQLKYPMLESYDLMSYIVMKDYNINTIITNDKGFDNCDLNVIKLSTTSNVTTELLNLQVY